MDRSARGLFVAERMNMKIVHVTSYFKENMAYHENYLTVGHKELGNEVSLITSNVEYEFNVNKENRVHEYGVSDYKGVTIHRIHYYFEIKNHFVWFRGLKKKLELIQPDIIFYYDQDPCLFTCIRYVKKHGGKLCILGHSSYENSMHSLFGRPYQKVLWRTIDFFVQKYFDAFICNSPESVTFTREIFRIDDEKLHLVSLPGDTSLTKNYEQLRKTVRNELGIGDDEIAFFHTGKLPEEKKTKEVLTAFTECRDDRFKLFVVGDVVVSFKPILDKYCIRDGRIKYLGWKQAEELKRLFIGGDILLQPGSLSNTFIEAICCRLPVVLLDTPQGRFLTKFGNGYLLKDNAVETIRKGILHVIQEDVINEMKKNSIFASSNFHYKEIARQTLELLK